MVVIILGYALVKTTLPIIILFNLISQLKTEKPHYFVGCKQIPEKKFWS